MLTTARVHPDVTFDHPLLRNKIYWSSAIKYSIIFTFLITLSHWRCSHEFLQQEWSSIQLFEHCIERATKVVCGHRRGHWFWWPLGFLPQHDSTGSHNFIFNYFSVKLIESKYPHVLRKHKSAFESGNRLIHVHKFLDFREKLWTTLWNVIFTLLEAES